MSVVTRLWVALVALAVGAALSALLLLEHHGQAGSLSQLCGDGAQSGCETVARSAWAAPLGVPLAAVGLAFYVSLVLLCALAATRAEDDTQRALARGILVASSAALLLDLLLLGAQAFAIHAYCRLCLGTYVVNAVVVVLLWPLRASPWAPLQGGANRPLAAGFYVAALGVLAAVAGWDTALRARAAAVTPTAVLGDTVPGSLAEAQARVRELQATLDDPEKLQRYLDDKAMREFEQQVPQLVDLSDAPTQPASAPLHVVEYSDMLCPFCRSLAQGLHAWLPTSAGRVAITFKHYPLDQGCNAGVSRTLHPGACRLALGAICAHEQGRFWTYHDAVFATELKEASDADVRRLAQQAGLDLARLTTCMQSARSQARLQVDIEEARRLGVQATPTVLVNGRKLPSINMFMRAVERESARLGLPALAPAGAAGQTH